jgi:hypothetical protein
MKLEQMHEWSQSKDAIMKNIKNHMETKLEHRHESNVGEDAKVKQDWSWSKHRNDSNSEVSTNIGTKLKRKKT